MRGNEEIRSIAARALQMDEAQREAFLTTACEEDPEAMRGVLELIGQAEGATGTAITQSVNLIRYETDPTWDHCFRPEQIVDERFRIIRFISQGGMGEVYAALDLNLQQRVALKTIRPRIAAHAEIIGRFKTEVKQSLRVTHPNVCRVHQLASHREPGGSPIWFLTMELLDGPTLSEHLESTGPMQSERALVLIRQVLSGLACAHQAGIVHRDLKPGNLMLVNAGPEGERLVITDFGLAISGSTGEAVGIAGTPAYMAPEQASGREVGPSADVFALGLIICEMLTRSRPKLDFAAAEKCDRQRDEWLASHPEVKPLMRSLIVRCLRFRPEDRFEDAREIVSMLDARKRRSITERLALAGMVVAASVALSTFFVPALGERIVNAVQLTPENTVSGEASLSPDGKYLAYMSNRADASNSDIWFQSLPGGEPRRLTRNKSGDEYPSVSPDGKTVAFRSERDGGGIYSIGADGSGERLLVAGGRNPVFAPNGNVITYWQGTEGSHHSGEIYVYPLDRGIPRRVASDFDDATFPTWIDGGRMLLFFGCRASTGANDCPDWWAVDPTGGEPSNTGVAALMRRHRIEPDFPPRIAWKDNHVVLSGHRERTFRLWDIALTGTAPHAAGRPVQVTFGDQDEKTPFLSEDGTIALTHVNGALHLWRVAASSGSDESELDKLTDNVDSDCCAAVSGDGRSLFFTRQSANFWQLMKVDLVLGKESAVYVSGENKFWPLPNSSGSLVAFESRSANLSSIMLWKQNRVRTVCNDCSHPGAWISDGKELLYTTAARDIGVLNIESGQTRTILTPGRDEVLSYPDWSSQNGHILFTATNRGVKQLFASRLPAEGAAKPETWIPLTSQSEAADLARWSADGTHFFYYGRQDGDYCLWQNSFDFSREAVGHPSALKHFHDEGRGPDIAFPNVLGLSVAGDRIYINVGEVTATVWVGHLRGNPLSALFQKVFE